MALFGRRRARRRASGASAAPEVVEAGDSPLDPQQAAAEGRRLLQTVPVGAADERARLSVIGGLTVDLEVLSGRTGAPGLLNEAIDLGRALTGRCAGWPEEAAIRSNLAGALLRRFQTADTPADLDEAFAQACAAVAAGPPGHPDRARSLSNLSYALRMRSDRDDSAGDLDTSIHALREALAATALTDPDRLGRLVNLGATLHRRFDRSGGHDDLDESIETSRAASRIAVGDQRLNALTNLWSALVDRVQANGRADDLDESVEVGRERARLLTTRPPGAPPASQRAMFLSLHARMLRTRFTHDGDVSDLDEAISTQRQAVELATAAHDDLSGYHRSLAELLRLRAHPPAAADAEPPRHRRDRLDARAQRSGSLDDLDEAVRVAREIVDQADGDPADPADPQRWSDHQQLAELLRRRYERTGDLDDLSRAIDLWRATLAATPNDHPGRVSWQGNLAVALRIRAERMGDIRDLHAAIPLQQAVVESSPADLRARGLTNLADLLAARYQHDGVSADLDRAIELGRAALAASGANDSGFVRTNLAGILLQDHERGGAPGAVTEAVGMLRTAVAETPAFSPRLATRRAALARALLTQADRTDDAAALDEAIGLLRAAVDELSDGDAARRPRLLANLAGGLWRRHERTVATGSQANGAVGNDQLADFGDLDEAARLWEQALGLLPWEHPDRQTLQGNLHRAREARARNSHQDEPRTAPAPDGAESASAEPASAERPSAGAVPSRPADGSDGSDASGENLRLLTQGLVRTDVHESWIDLVQPGSGPDLTAAIEQFATMAAHYRGERDYRGAIIAEQNHDFLVRAAQVGGPAAARETLRRADLTVLRAATPAFYRIRDPTVERLLLTAFPAIPRLASPPHREDTGASPGSADEPAWYVAKVAAFDAHAALGVVVATDDALWRTGAAAAFDLARAYDRRDESGRPDAGPPDGELAELPPVEVAFALAVAALTVLPPDVSEDDLHTLLALTTSLAQRLHDQIGTELIEARHAEEPSDVMRWDVDHLMGAADWVAILGERLLTLGLTDAERIEALHCLAIALVERHDCDGHAADLDRLIDVLTELTELIPTGDPERLRVGFQLAVQYEQRYLDAGRATDLDAAIEGYARVLGALPAGEQLHSMVRGRLRDARLQRFRASRRIADIDAVVDLSEAAAAERTTGSDRILRLINLAEALRERHDLTRRVADIDRAVALGRQALDASVAGGLPHAEVRSQLALSLRGRFIQNGAAEDVDEAVEQGRAAAAAASERTDHHRFLAALANLLMLRVGAVWPPEAAALARERAQVGSAEQRRQAAVALGRWFRTDVDRQADVTTAIGLYRQALAAVPTDDQNHAGYLNDLASTLQMRPAPAAASPTADPDAAADAPSDEDAALDALIAAARLVGPGDVSRSTILRNLGAAWQQRAERSGSPQAFAAAVECLRAAATDPTGPASPRLRTAMEWGQAARAAGDPAGAVEAYASALARLHEVTWQGRDRPHQERELSARARLARDAAAVALDAGQPERAVELLELGRSVLWTQLLDLRGDDSELAARAPALHAELGQIRTTLDSEAAVTPAQRIALAQRWDDLVAQVRGLDGFSDFLRPVPLDRLLRGAVGGTVVIINLSALRCDALLARPDGVRVVPLPALSDRDVGARVDGYLGALRAAEQARQAQQAAWSAVPSPASSGPGLQAALQAAQRAERELLRAQEAAEVVVTATLEWLWDAIAQPVLTALGHLQAPAADEPWPRVWWCPTGPLALVPLHAAGYHRTPADGPARAVLDLVVSSYTPTLRALLAARTPDGPAVAAPAADESGRLLAVALPDTPGQAPLAGVDAELAVLADHFGDDHLTVLRADAATRQAVRRALDSHSWVHFSCHGTQDLADPSSGGLVLHDGVLAVADVARLRRRGEFAALSACKTATGGVELADETITLAAALQHSGYRHVVATLWSVYDGPATTAVFRAVYGEVTAGGTPRAERLAEALHRAVVALREDHRDEPSIWTPFAHTGP